MHKFETKVNGIMKICKRVLSADLDKRGNIPRRRGPKPHWSDCFIIAISLLAEFEGIDSESCLIAILQKHKREFHHLISRRQYNDRRRALLPYCTKLQQHLAKRIDKWGGLFLHRCKTDSGMSFISLLSLSFWKRAEHPFARLGLLCLATNALFQI